jgi:hypothetical protein
MPEKTHFWPWDCWRVSQQTLFELLRAAVSQRRVHSSAIVVPLEELADVGLQIGAVAVLPGMDFLLFERLHEARRCSLAGAADRPASSLDSAQHTL